MVRSRARRCPGRWCGNGRQGRLCVDFRDGGWIPHTLERGQLSDTGINSNVYNSTWYFRCGKISTWSMWKLREIFGNSYWWDSLQNSYINSYCWWGNSGAQLRRADIYYSNTIIFSATDNSDGIDEDADFHDRCYDLRTLRWWSQNIRYVNRDTIIHTIDSHSRYKATDPVFDASFILALIILAVELSINSIVQDE